MNIAIIPTGEHLGKVLGVRFEFSSPTRETMTMPPYMVDDMMRYLWLIDRHDANSPVQLENLCVRFELPDGDSAISLHNDQSVFSKAKPGDVEFRYILRGTLDFKLFHNKLVEIAHSRCNGGKT